MSEGSIAVDTMVTLRVSLMRGKTADGESVQLISFPDVSSESEERAWVAQWMIDAFGVDLQEVDEPAVETGAAGVV